MSALCPHGQEEGDGVVNQMWTGLDRGGGPKNPQISASILYGWLQRAKKVIALQNLCQNHNPKTNYSWEQYQEPMDEFLQAFHDYVESGCLRSKSFHFCITSLNDILPILIDLTKSDPKGD